MGLLWQPQATAARVARASSCAPRYTRTSANADLYAPLRPGTDIAFLGGLIHYVLENERYFKEYVLRYTNASTIINKRFQDTEDQGGLFSGYDPEKGSYDPSTWSYEGEQVPSAAGHHQAQTGESFGARLARAQKGPPPRDETLQHPRCVFQLLKKHFARYTPEMVEQVCGTPREIFLQIAEAITANSGRERTTAFCYAVGWTQHTVGVQNIRAVAILQLLLGNIGRPGGGILALRGHATIQGSTDVPTLYNLLPGYIQMPLEQNKSLKEWEETQESPTGWWYNAPKYQVSLLKAWYGEHATQENEWRYQHLPKLNGDYSYYPMFFKMKDGGMRGLFVMGENFAVGGPGAKLEREAMRKLEWCVVRDPYLVETAAPPAAAGFTAGSSLKKGATWLAAGCATSPANTPTTAVGGGPGRIIGASSTTAPRLTRMASPGRSASGSSGGTNQPTMAKASGRATMCPTLS